MDRWCVARGVARGATLTVTQTWDLATRWYHNRLDIAYHGRSVAEAEALFADLRLVGPFWRA